MLILLRDQVTPASFYGDLWGVPAKGLAPVPALSTLLLLRKAAACGKETNVFEGRNLIGFVQEGDDEHADSGIAAVLTNGSAGKKHLCLGRRHACELFRDALLACSEPETGTGNLPVRGGSVSVYVSEKLYRWILLAGC